MMKNLKDFACHYRAIPASRCCLPVADRRPSRWVTPTVACRDPDAKEARTKREKTAKNARKYLSGMKLY
jgi:hypothetical protein